MAIVAANQVQLIHNHQVHIAHFLPAGLAPPPAEHVPVLRRADHNVAALECVIVSHTVALHRRLMLHTRARHSSLSEVNRGTVTADAC